MRKDDTSTEYRPAVLIEHLLHPVEHRAAVLAELRSGLTASQKRVAPMWFYDEAGSTLFDRITRLPEYHVTRSEREILVRCAPAVAALTKATTLVELGSGTSEKTTILLDALDDSGHLSRFVPLDISGETLEGAAAVLHATYPQLSIHGIVGDFHHHLSAIPEGGPRLVAFLGSTIGNLDPGQRRRFFGDLDAALWSSDWLLLGTDLVRDRDELVAAYDDAAGVTAEFNKNLLLVLNRELEADFDLDLFEHVVRWDEDRSWIEMRLRSRRDQRVTVPGLGLELRFRRGEDLWTEISTKFRPEQVEQELLASGFVTEATYFDDARRFMVTLARPWC